MIQELLQLCSLTNAYIHGHLQSFSLELVYSVVQFVQRMLDLFGVIVRGEGTEPLEVVNLVNALVNFRSSIRRIALSSPPEVKRTLLQCCDELRDKILPENSILLQVLMLRDHLKVVG